MKKDITTKFNDFKANKIKKFDKEKTYTPLSDDIIAMSKLDNGEYTKIKGPMEIVQITGMITDEEEIKKLDEVAGGPVLNTDIGLKQVKRGDIIWLTAILQKPSSTTAYNTQSLCTIKARVVDWYLGLNKLNQMR